MGTRNSEDIQIMLAALRQLRNPYQNGGKELVFEEATKLYKKLAVTVCDRQF